jgi:hypothetical protein
MIQNTQLVSEDDQTTLKWKRRLRRMIAPFVLLTVLVVAGAHFLRFGSSSKGMSGEFLHAVAAPSVRDGYHLWIMTDGSRHYIQRTQTPGRVSVARKCWSCKTWIYVYDPVQERVLAKFKTDYKALILYTWLAYQNGKVWVVTGPYDQNEPKIYVYRTEPAGLIQETSGIIGDHPELGSGLIDIKMRRDPDRLILDTKDGRTGLILALSDEKLYKNENEYRRAQAQDEEEQVTVFALGLVDGGPRKQLYKVTGPKSRIKDGSLEFQLKDAESLKISANAAAEPAASGRLFIEGMIVDQDAEGCLILHQDSAGKTAARLLTRVDGGGQVKWTIGAAELFKEMKVNIDKDPTSAIFFMKDKIGVSRAGNLVLVQLKGAGIIGFEFESGKKLWDVRF